MILQPFAYRQVRDYRNAQPLQQRAGADARELQQLRRVEATAGEDHFALGLESSAVD